MHRRLIWPLRLSLVLLSILIAVILCEVALRLTGAARRGRFAYVWPPGIHAVFDPDPNAVPGVSGRSHFVVNSDGLRGDERSPQDRLRILAIGGSTTECLLLDQRETWPALLQAELSRCTGTRVWVGNAGRSGATLRHHVVAMERLPLNELGIHLVLVLVGINDLCLRLSQDRLFDPRYLERPGAREALLSETFAGNYQPNPNKPFYKRTYLWQTALRTRDAMRGGHVQDRAGLVLERWRAHRRTASEYRDTLPDLDAALQAYETDIHRMIDLATANGVQIAFLTQPCLWRPDLAPGGEAMLWMGGVGNFQVVEHQPYYAAAALARGMALYNERLVQVCRERSVHCLDLAAALQADSTVFYDDCHFTERGARQVADHVARFVRNGSWPFPKAVPLR